MGKSYLWIGMCCSQEEKDHIISCGGKLLSAIVSQDNLVWGLNKEIDMDSINSVRVPSYPLYKEKKIKKFEWSRTGKSKDVNVSYLNYKYIGLYFKTRALEKTATKWAKQHKTDEVTVFVYSMHSPFMSAAKVVKKVIPTAKIVLIVPDLPQFMDLGMNKIKKVLKAIDWKKIQGLMKSVDKYILYSKHMAEFLKLKDGSWTVMEGSINENDVLDETVEKNKDIISVMYSGVCDLRYGIPELLDAFELIKEENYELWITGAGNATPLIKERAEKDNRIKFFGFLPSRKDLLLKQKQATMMINTRKPDEKASAYCFPSKLFEYMISGNPVLSFDIKGIPEEYFNYLVKIEEVSPKSIAEAIKKVADMPEEQRIALGESSKKFVIENKNKNVQAKKILEFVNEEKGVNCI